MSRISSSLHFLHFSLSNPSIFPLALYLDVYVVLLLRQDLVLQL
jgi:hypothetical protein